MKSKLILAFLVISSATFAQKLKQLDGDIKNLKGISEYNLEFDYSDLEIPKFDSEEDFLADKMNKREEKEAGTGEKFRASWFSDREEFYQPKFIESFNKRFDDGEIVLTPEKTDAKHTMQIHTTLIYSGYNVGIVRKNAYIDAVITVYEAGNPDNVLYSGKYFAVQGGGAMGYDFNTGYRISEAYAKLAKSFAGLIRKKALK
tara:strand:- start:556 stop:1161 length:606 start_codon:yes stop_codon:yes gene_type:complete